MKNSSSFTATPARSARPARTFFSHRTARAGFRKVVGFVLLALMLAFVACVFGLSFTASNHDAVGAYAVTFVVCALLAPRSMSGLCYTATLILPILTGKVMAAFKTKVPELNFFSSDFGKTGSDFAMPVKFGQEVISQIAQIPNVVDYTPGDDLTSSSQNVKDLVSDVKVKIDRGRVVKLKLPAVDVNTLLLMPAFLQLVEEAGAALGKDVVLTAVAQATAGNFSQRKVQSAATTDLDTLEGLRGQMNGLGTLTPRYVIGTTDFTSKIQNDPRVMSNQFYNQRTTDDPYTSLVNIKGFKEVREFPSFPAGTAPAADFTAATTDVVTPAGQVGTQGHWLFNNGDRVRLTTTTTLPAGLALATDYFVIAATSTTCKFSAALGGAAVDITDTGTGAHTMTRAENLSAIAFEKRGIHIAIRPPVDAIEMARTLGIPVPILSQIETDPVTGLTFAAFMFIDNKQDIYVAFAVQFGVRAGRSLTNAADPASETAGSGLDYAAVRVVTA